MEQTKEDLIQQFSCTFSALNRVMHHVSAISLEEKMTTMLQFQALSFLKEHPGCTVGELAAELGVSSAGVAQLTDRLFNAARIIRLHDESDRRVTRLSLTQDGESQLAQIKQKHLETMSRFLSLIPEKDLQEIIRIQSELIKKLEGKKK